MTIGQGQLFGWITPIGLGWAQRRTKRIALGRLFLPIVSKR